MTQEVGNITHLEKLSFHNTAMMLYFWQFLDTKQTFSYSLHLQIPGEVPILNVTVENTKPLVFNYFSKTIHS